MRQIKLENVYYICLRVTKFLFEKSRPSDGISYKAFRLLCGRPHITLTLFISEGKEGEHYYYFISEHYNNMLLAGRNFIIIIMANSQMQQNRNKIEVTFLASLVDH